MTGFVPAAKPATTPARIVLTGAVDERIRHVSRTCAALSDDHVSIVPAYSFKTSPKRHLVDAALHAGFWAEVIGARELAWARRVGFPGERIVYNGPEPAPALSPAERIAVCFADSLEAFERNAELQPAITPGIRLRPSMIGSRFGVTIEEDASLIELAKRDRDAPLGVSMHARREDYRGATWLDLCDDLIERAERLERHAGRAVSVFDVGGGWEPHQFDEVFESDARALLPRIERRLKNVRRILIEPGQAVATPSEALLTSVLELRRRNGRIEAIVDLGYNDWPQQHSFVHPIYALKDGGWSRLPEGRDRVGGRTCLEYDVIDGVSLPENLGVGDVLLMGDVGAYDSSMAYRFGSGDW